MTDKNRKRIQIKKVLCGIGIIAGVIFTIQGIIATFYNPPLHLSSYRFGSDYYTESYNALYMIFNAVGNTGVSTVHVIGDLLTIFGIFNICIFGIKIIEIPDITESDAKENCSDNSSITQPN